MADKPAPKPEELTCWSCRYFVIGGCPADVPCEYFTYDRGSDEGESNE